MKLSTFLIAPLLVAVSSAAILKPSADLNRRGEGTCHPHHHPSSPCRHKSIAHTHFNIVGNSKYNGIVARAAEPDPDAIHIKDLLLKSPEFGNLPPDTIEFLKKVPAGIFDALTGLSPEDFLAAIGDLTNRKIPTFPGVTSTMTALPAATSKA
ncbi:hypothetical protein Dda_5271 [Drechslerella dactyloides]|uniref:Uncharacterized protein n=1 Tax=Drechslerella dactyloides TaxID=74499 RepID=A0AAD6IVY4_DREDA|nr:hypothetical protein Dda_5271 [Drechslerella dactyloides]